MAYEQNLFPYTKKFEPKTVKIILVLIVLCIFCFSLTQNAFVVEGINENIVHSSVSLFLMGSTAILGGGVLEWIIWLANPICLISIAMFLYNESQLERALQLNFIALILSCSFYFWKEVLIAESGATGKIISFENGYYLWIASIVLLFVFQLFYYKSIKIKA